MRVAHTPYVHRNPVGTLISCTYPRQKWPYRPLFGRYVHGYCHRMPFCGTYKVCAARALFLGGYGGDEDWCRSEEDSVPGAGRFFSAGPAPHIGLLRSPAVPVCDKKNDLRQFTRRPATDMQYSIEEMHLRHILQSLPKIMQNNRVFALSHIFLFLHNISIFP